MSIDGSAAAQTLLARGSCTPGLCLNYVWLAYKAHGAGTGRSAGTAYEAWLKSDGKHPGDRNPPAGVPVFWGPRSGSAAGDVVISLGGGRVVATDWPRNGVIGVTTLSQRESQIGRPYLGWAESIFDVDVLGAAAAPASTPTPAPPAPEPDKENDMKIIAGPNGAQAFADEFGFDPTGNYFYVPAGGPDWTKNILASWFLANKPDRDLSTDDGWIYELARHQANARWAQKRAQIVADTVAALTPVLQLLTPTIDDAVVQKAIDAAVSKLTIPAPEISDADKAEIAQLTVELQAQRLAD